ncbi:hypothetical protein ACVW00_000208 [Marmoricola sp. URHA0025 HA25]
MPTVVKPARRLPARVYWFRRTMVLLTAVALVFAIGRMLGGSGSPTPGDTANVTAAKPSTTPTTTAPAVAGPQPFQPTPTGKGAGPTGGPVVLAVPDGPCAADEITVTPSVPTAVAAGRVDLVLDLTGIKPACTFSVSSRTVAAKVVSGKDRIWSTQDCPDAVKTASVVVRSAQPTRIVVPWSGRRSDADCSKATPWALPGYYHLTAAVIGSEPGDAQFRLQLAPRQVITKTAHPKTKKGSKGTVCGGDNAATSC